MIYDYGQMRWDTSLRDFHRVNEAMQWPQSGGRAFDSDRALKMYRNDFQDQVLGALSSMFAKESFEAMKLYVHSSTNILERVVRETCRLYQEPATRYLRGMETDRAGRRRSATGRISELMSLDDLQLMQEDVGPDSETAVSEAPEAKKAGKLPFENYLRVADPDALMSEVQRLWTFQPVVWVMPLVRERRDGSMKLVFDVYTPSVADVEFDPSDPTEPVNFITWRDEVVESKTSGLTKRSKERVYYEWTFDTFAKYDRDHQLLDEQPNLLGRLPIVACRGGMAVDGYFLEGVGDDLYEATLEISVLRTLESKAFLWASFKQLALHGRLENIPPEQVMGNPAHPIYLGESADKAEVLNFAPDLAQLRESITQRIQDIATKYGISPASWTMSERAQSGFSKKMDQATIIRNNREQRKWAAKAESEIYKLTALTLQHHPVDEIGKLDPDAEYVVDFVDPKFEEEPIVQARADALDLKLNKVSILDLVLRDNPDLTDEEAVQQIALNRAINERFLTANESSLLDLLALDGKGQPQGGGTHTIGKTDDGVGPPIAGSEGDDGA